MILLAAFLLIAVSIYGIYFYWFHHSKYYDLIQYEEKLPDIKMQENIEVADGYIMFDGNTEYAEIRLQVKEEREEEISDNIDESLGIGRC
ncbi:MAG: hypothetical protein J6K58_13325 [Lachnospiraceae bacterium]|nr:hypothetical protein [Lachnospiraceae bacterium]